MSNTSSDLPDTRPVSFWEEPRSERLRGWHLDLQRDVAFYGALAATGTGGDPPWRAQAKACLDDGKAAVRSRNREQLARSCAHAYRFLIHGLPETELEARADALRYEALEKLSGWRRSAVENLLGTEKNPEEIDAARLSLAQLVIDVHFQNVYFKLEVVAHFVPWLSVALGMLALGTMLYSGFLATEDATSFLGDPEQTTLVLFLGAMGAVLSNTTTLLGATGRIPQVISGLTNFSVRPLFGAVSAVAVAVILQSGYLPIDQPTTNQLYAVALLSGFSDQLLTRVMRKVEEKAAA